MASVKRFIPLNVSGGDLGMIHWSGDQDMDWKVKHVEPREVTRRLSTELSELTSELCQKEVKLSVSDVRRIARTLGLFVASKESRAIGMAVLVRMPLPQGERWLVESVVVMPEFRNKGVASSILSVVMNNMSKLPGCQLNLTCNPSRLEAIQLYQNLGFKKAQTSVYRFSMQHEIQTHLISEKKNLAA